LSGCGIGLENVFELQGFMVVCEGYCPPYPAAHAPDLDYFF
jgi:hypothetical protein